MDEKKETQDKKPEEIPTVDSKEGVQPEPNKEVERLNTETEGINKAIAENENAKGRERIAGVAQGGKTEEAPTPETDEEYTEKFKRGEVTPLKI